MRLDLTLSMTGRRGPSYGPELVTNGTFDSDVTGWSVVFGSSTWSAGKMRVTSDATAGQVDQSIAVTNGATYRLQASMTPSVSNYGSIALASGTFTTGSPNNAYYEIDGGTIDRTFVAGGANINIKPATNNTSAWAPNGQYVEFDNISVKRVL